MTTLKRCNNWKLSIYGREHGAPHVHVTGANFRASVAIANGAVLAGSLPADVLQEAQAWLQAHRLEALASWQAHNPSL